MGGIGLIVGDHRAATTLTTTSAVPQHRQSTSISLVGGWRVVVPWVCHIDESGE